MPRALRVEGVLQQRVSTNRGSYIQAFLQPGVLQPGV